MLPAFVEIIPAAAVAVVLVVALRNAERDGLEATAMLRAGMIGLAGAVLGGGALGWPDGYSALGAFAGAFLAGAMYLRARRESVLAYADSAAAGVALGYAVMRLACLLEGHCFGTPSSAPWAITYGPDSPAFRLHLSQGWIDASALHSLAVHPTQLYHAAVGIAGFLVLRGMRGTRLGSRVVAAMLIYGAGRFAIEFFRADAIPVWWRFDWNQLACLAMLAVGLGVVARFADLRPAQASP